MRVLLAFGGFFCRCAPLLFPISRDGYSRHDGLLGREYRLPLVGRIGSSVLVTRDAGSSTKNSLYFLLLFPMYVTKTKIRPFFPRPLRCGTYSNR
jgi:hypothetical protein